jgi:AcrR family transcriptional regulator
MSRKQEIIQAAAELFAIQGYHGTSIQDLSQAVGLGKSSLYQHIASKEELLFWVHEQFINPLLAATKERVRPDMDPREALQTLSRVLMRVIADYQPYVRVFLNEWRALPQPRLDEIMEKRKLFECYVGEALQRGIDQRVFYVPDVPTARLAFLGMHNYAYQWLNPHGRLPPEEIARQFSDIFLHGIERS